MKDFNIDELEWPLLTKDDIQVKVNTCTDKGSSLLLYKDARCDQNILDKVVGNGNWQRDHKLIRDTVYCGVGIYNKNTNGWVWKWDAGAESFAEKEKGEASDSFKRACFNWGIGRELYSKIRIYVPTAVCPTVCTDQAKGKWTLKDKFTKFRVEYIEYDEHKLICKLIVSMEQNFKWVEIMRHPKGDTKFGENSGSTTGSTVHDDVSQGSVKDAFPGVNLPETNTAPSGAKPQGGKNFPMCTFLKPPNYTYDWSMKDEQEKEILSYDLEHMVAALAWWKKKENKLKMSYERINRIEAAIKTLREASGEKDPIDDLPF